MTSSHAVGVEDELARIEFGGGPQNFCTDPEVERRYLDSLQSRDSERITKDYAQVMRNLRFQQHTSSADARNALPSAFWGQAFKFAVDRHPYEKVISLLWWRKRVDIANGADPRDFLDALIERGEYRNFDLYSDSDGLLVDQVFRYENLWAEIGNLGRRLGFEVPQVLPRAKAQHRQDVRPAIAVLSEQQRRKIQSVCAEEFELLAYNRL